MATRSPPEPEATWVQLVPLKFQMLPPPTVQTSVAEIASMAVTAMPVGRFASEVHVVPLNCRICGKLPFPLPPMAKMSVLETAEIPLKDGWAVGGDGAWTILQLVPLKFSIRSAEPVPPTAQTSVGEMAVTALSVPAVAGFVWMLQDVPLKCSTSGVLTDHPAAVDTEADTDGPDVVTGHGAYAGELGDRRTRRGGRGDHRPARAVEDLGQRPHVSGARALRADGEDVGGRYRRDRAQGRPRDGRARHDLEGGRGGAPSGRRSP